MGGRLQIFIEEGLIAISTGTDGALDWVEGFLTFLGCGNR